MQLAALREEVSEGAASISQALDSISASLENTGLQTQLLQDLVQGISVNTDVTGQPMVEALLQATLSSNDPSQPSWFAEQADIEAFSQCLTTRQKPVSFSFQVLTWAQPETVGAKASAAGNETLAKPGNLGIPREPSGGGSLQDPPQPAPPSPPSARKLLARGSRSSSRSGDEEGDADNWLRYGAVSNGTNQWARDQVYYDLQALRPVGVSHVMGLNGAAK